MKYKYFTHSWTMDDVLVECAVEMAVKHDWKSWSDYHYQMWRWYFWWSTLEEYKVWEDIVDSDWKLVIIEKIDIRI